MYKQSLKAALLLLATATLVGCNSPVDETKMSEDILDSSSQDSGSCTLYNYGTGVHYFYCTEKDFAMAIAAFKQKNPTVVVTTVTGNGTGVHGKDEGYFVSTEPRETNTTEK